MFSACLPALLESGFSEEDIQRLRPVAVFDFLVNNADRKGGHILRDQEGHLWLIDHGLCFHADKKLRTIIWDFVGEKIPPDIRKDLEDLLSKLENKGDLFELLAELLQPGEIQAASRRIHRLLEDGVFPFPDGMQRPYPWPPV